MASSNEFGPTCRYQYGVSHVCTTPEELAKYEEDGWTDTPTKYADDFVIDGEAVTVNEEEVSKVIEDKSVAKEPKKSVAKK